MHVDFIHENRIIGEAEPEGLGARPYALRYGFS